MALARDTRFDLIVMDLQMPILDGLQATAALRRFERIRSRPADPHRWPLADPGRESCNASLR